MKQAGCLMLVAKEQCQGFLSVGLYLTLLSWFIQYLVHQKQNYILQHNNK